MNKNTRLLVIQVAVVLGMLGVAFAFVPLYRMFCQAFNIPVPRVAVGEGPGPEAPLGPDGRTVEVRFVAEVARGVPVRFAPLTFKMKVPVGKPVLAAYDALNTGPAGLDGVAVHMVYGMGGPGGDMLDYIDLRQCFCFELQHYPAGEEKRLPLNFIVRPNLPQGVHTITFAYTLFQALPGDSRVKPGVKKDAR